jgi:CDP-diacylglycerol--glycerol-3-phosphate 3-phosphatidyltransferase
LESSNTENEVNNRPDDPTKSAGPDEWEIDNLPNRLTLFRVILIPIIVGCLYVNIVEIPFFEGHRVLLSWIAAWTFVVASITDFFDGYFARKRNIVTIFGSFLDPIADKFLVASSLIMLQGLDRIPVWVVIVLVLREIYITSLRLLGQEKGLSVPVGKLGKWKTATQMVGIPLLMASQRPWGIPMATMGSVLIYASGIISIYSALEYSMNLVRKLKAKRRKQDGQG